MRDRPRMEEALDVLRAELEVGRSTKSELTTRAAWLAFMRFARQREFRSRPTTACPSPAMAAAKHSLT